MTDLARTPTL